MFKHRWIRILLILPVLLAVFLLCDWGTLCYVACKPEMPLKRQVPIHRVVDLRVVTTGDLPRYIDVNVGDIFQIVTVEGLPLDTRVRAIRVESGNLICPRTNIELEVAGLVYPVLCGMRSCDGIGGIEPTRIGSVKISAELTELLFSQISAGPTRFNSYENLRLKSQGRLAIWSASGGILGGLKGSFVVRQPQWARGKYGNWLHKTYYGMHAAIDVFSTENRNPEAVLAPLEAVVCGVFAKDVGWDSPNRIKAIYLKSHPIGDRGQALFFRMLHLSEIMVSPGQHVKAGQIIGLTGHTGFSPLVGDHLHFEIRLNPSIFGGRVSDRLEESVPVNPYPYLLEWWEASLNYPDKVNRD